MSAEAVERFACFGGVCEVRVDGPEAATLAASARARLLDWHGRYTRFTATSELARLNADEREELPVAKAGVLSGPAGAREWLPTTAAGSRRRLRSRARIGTLGSHATASEEGPMHERRRAPRTHLELPCSLRRRVGGPIAARTVDISPNGMSVTTQRPLTQDELLEFEFAERDITGRARVMRQEGHATYGLRFESVPAAALEALTGIVA